MANLAVFGEQMRKNFSYAAIVGSVLALSGCMEAPVFENLANVKPVAFVKEKLSSNDAGGAHLSGADGTGLSSANSGEGSDIIAALATRRSVLEPGSEYASLSSKLMDSSAGVAQAELRAAKLRSVARNSNWLPTVGPSISLNALGELASGLLVEQVLYDNGRKKAERAFAAADVEVSAVALSQDANDRVFTGLKLMVSEAQAREKAEMAESGLGRMREFNRVISERVRGGLSSLSDQRVVQSKVATMDHEASNHREGQRSFASELASMLNASSAPELTQARGVRLPAADNEPLEVTRARAEAIRAQAEEKVERAGLLPTLSAGGILGKKNSASVDYEGTGLGLGTKAAIEASKARAQAAQAKVNQARQEASRKRARTQSDLEALQRKERDASDIVQRARANYRLYQDQFEAGKKTVMEVLSVYEEMVRSEMDLIDIRYDAVLAQLELARQLGALANGSEI